MPKSSACASCGAAPTRRACARRPTTCASSSGQSDRFRAGLQRAGVWESHIAQTLAAQGLPPEIAALPHVESSFQPTAMSKAGAAGMWQFIRSTGRRYLRIDSAVDERLDPYRATEAAAQLLSYNYRLLGSWPLAITAYNHGAEGMRRARDQVGSDDIVRIVREYHSPTFGFASRNYYCSFLAALRLDRDPEKYFGPLTPEPAATSHELRLAAPVRADSLAKTLQLDRDTLRTLNPALRADGLEPAAPDPERLPAAPAREPEILDRRECWRAPSVACMPPAPLLAVAAQPHAAPTPPGGRSAAPCRRWSPRLPLRVSAGPSARASLSTAELAAASASYDAMYIVRSGDTLATIAVRTGVDPERLMAINGLSDTEHIYEGQRLGLETGSAHATADALLAAQAVAEDRQDQVQAQVAAAHSQPALSAAQAQAQGPALAGGRRGAALGRSDRLRRGQRRSGGRGGRRDDRPLCRLARCVHRPACARSITCTAAMRC